MTPYNVFKETVASALFEKDYGEPWDEATETARWHWLEMADCAIRAMDRSDAMSVMHTLATVMDGIMPLLDAAAIEEARAGHGKAMRTVTQQRRREAAMVAVERAFELLRVGGTL
jgi:hypothetical protein